jgi:hypothetical protein
MNEQKLDNGEQEIQEELIKYREKHPVIEPEWDDVWFGKENELTLVRKYKNIGLFSIAIAMDGETDIDQMLSVSLVDDEIPFLIAALQFLMTKKETE